MEELNRQVQRAQRKLNLQQFLRGLVWSLCIALTIAVLAVGAKKLWVIPVADSTWTWSWLGGAVLAGLSGAAVWTYLRRFRRLDAALELDRRFGLKERVSSSLALHPNEAESAAGQALLQDAVRRVERIDVGERFRFSASWWSLAPVVPAGLACVLALFIPSAQPGSRASANATSNTQPKAVRKSTEVLQKKVAERRQQAAESGLEEAGELFDKLEKGVEQLAKKEEVDRKQALVTLSDLAEELKKRREEMGGGEELKDQLKQLNNMQSGPADEMARAMKKGDFAKALDELNELKDKLATNSMTDDEKKALAEQMQQMANKMNELAKAHDEAKKNLEDEINRMKQAGDMQRAEQLQQQLDQMNMRQQQMDQLAKMAQQLQQAGQKMKEGQPEAANENLEELAEMMEDMKQELDELEMLDDALNEIADAKNSMDCKKCGGAGCEFCQGMGGNGNEFGKQPGQGMGDGQGMGERPEAETDKKFFDSRVRGEIKRGARGVVTGTANGPNVAGNVLEDVKAAMEAASADDSDPLTDQRLPKSQRTQAQQYFDSIREGQ